MIGLWLAAIALSVLLTSFAVAAYIFVFILLGIKTELNLVYVDAFLFPLALILFAVIVMNLMATWGHEIGTAGTISLWASVIMLALAEHKITHPDRSITYLKGRRHR